VNGIVVKCRHLATAAADTASRADCGQLECCQGPRCDVVAPLCRSLFRPQIWLNFTQENGLHQTATSLTTRKPKKLAESRQTTLSEIKIFFVKNRFNLLKEDMHARNYRLV